jgi:Rad3-related DNA helicase
MLDLTKFPYQEIRSGQSEVLKKLSDNWNKYRFFVLELPTGFGKSAVAKTICSSFKNAFLVTATKQLQDQYIADFPDGSMKSIKGRANYQCDYNLRLNCEIGPCMVNKALLNECKRNNNCPYYNARNKALNANVALTSYQYFLRSTECGNFWKPRNVLILDECHLLEQQVTQWAGIFLSPRDLHVKYGLFENVEFDKFVVLSVPPEESGYKNNKQWLGNIWDLVVKKRDDLFKEMEISLGGKKPDDLTEEELELNIKKFLSELINNSQLRFVWYKEQLAEVHKHSELYPSWYKDFLRECKNSESLWLKNLQEETTNFSREEIIQPEEHWILFKE